MIKVALVVLVAMNLTACGRTHYEYYTGTQGPKGDTGATGATGEAGADGADGSDASPVTFVKFCPGATTYPSKFVEGGFCIQGKLYGTYSANGGFSTELPPGTYGSHGINASCNFTILPNCQISNN